MKNDRTEFELDVIFTHPETGEKVKTWVEIPFDVFVDAIREYCYRFKDVNLDGTDTNIWNLFAGIEDGLRYFSEDEEFIEICRELYKKSFDYEEDFEEWKDWYDYDHHLGEYSEEDEEY